MRIIYIARHGQTNSNDDEGAIAFALRKLGHDVECVHESRYDLITRPLRCDLVLFHHWQSFYLLKGVDCKKVFWNFDLVEWPDPTLEARNVARRTWMHEVIKVVDLGFCTDGDFAAKHSDRLVWLPQGFDERQKVVVSEKKGPSILFTGIGTGGGTQRESFVAEMQDRYGSEFLHYIKGLHGDKLARAIAEAKIVVAPDSPVTNRYWSNRVYNVLGMGGFLLHPYARGLEEQFSNTKLVMYKDRSNLHAKISAYMREPVMCDHFAEVGHKRTLEAHTYLRRCEVLMATVKARLGV